MVFYTKTVASFIQIQHKILWYSMQYTQLACLPFAFIVIVIVSFGSHYLRHSLQQFVILSVNLCQSVFFKLQQSVCQTHFIDS